MSLLERWSSTDPVDCGTARAGTFRAAAPDCGVPLEATPGCAWSMGGRWSATGLESELDLQAHGVQYATTKRVHVKSKDLRWLILRAPNTFHSFERRFDAVRHLVSKLRAASVSARSLRPAAPSTAADAATMTRSSQFATHRAASVSG